jgi:hypothetical protein
MTSKYFFCEVSRNDANEKAVIGNLNQKKILPNRRMNEVNK